MDDILCSPPRAFARATRLAQAGTRSDAATGAISTPIHQTASFRHPALGRSSGCDYSRTSNPTRLVLEQALAAIASSLMLFEPGDHLLVGRDVYGGTYRALTTLFRKWRLEAEFVDAADPDAVRRAVRPGTRGLFVETPANPLLQITDLAAMAQIAREHGLLSIADNTFMTPYLQRPLELGFDLVVHSATKFIGGHSDVVAGLAVAREAELGRRLRFIQNAFGAILGPQDAWLVQRGLRTLAVRLDAQQATATRLAAWLAARKDIHRVHHPSLDRHPGRDVHARQADGPGAVVSFELADGPAAVAFLKAVRLPLVGVSLGGVETILSYPATMSHAAMPRPERLARGIGDGLVRLSAGVESFEDLAVDLDAALDAAER